MLDWLLDPPGLTEHGFCLSWRPGLIAMHAGSDFVIGLAYLAIPMTLLLLIGRRLRWPGYSEQRFAFDKWNYCRFRCNVAVGVSRREGVARPEVCLAWALDWR
jgi:hypothetical protein